MLRARSKHLAVKQASFVVGCLDLVFVFQLVGDGIRSRSANVYRINGETERRARWQIVTSMQRARLLLVAWIKALQLSNQRRPHKLAATATPYGLNPYRLADAFDDLRMHQRQLAASLR
jgi:hypothetical protein